MCSICNYIAGLVRKITPVLAPHVIYDTAHYYKLYLHISYVIISFMHETLGGSQPDPNKRDWTVDLSWSHQQRTAFLTPLRDELLAAHPNHADTINQVNL